MALQDITNAPTKFRLHVDIDREYATLRSSRIAPTVEKISCLGMQGCKALDLWTDGGIYPRDPISRQPSPFQNITTLMQFLGDGFNGLLGYCNRLCSLSVHETGRRMELQAKYDKLQAASTSEIKKLREEIVDLLAQLAKQTLDSDMRLDNHIRVAENYICLQNRARNMCRRIDHLTHLPMGCVLWKRKRKSVEILAKKGGALKRRVRVTRVLAGSMLGMEGAGSELSSVYPTLTCDFMARVRHTACVSYHPHEMQGQEQAQQEGGDGGSSTTCPLDSHNNECTCMVFGPPTEEQAWNYHLGPHQEGEDLSHTVPNFTNLGGVATEFLFATRTPFDAPAIATQDEGTAATEEPLPPPIEEPLQPPTEETEEPLQPPNVEHASTVDLPQTTETVAQEGDGEAEQQTPPHSTYVKEAQKAHSY
ncbi:hypothetical protein L7F22_041308 [Adiantum nelumboides]|nr:hypothetical protein [Adiantum nelumboides]